MKALPSGWARRALLELQAKKKWALNGGPFGSKLVQRDYVDFGVPVIRGTNLSGDTRFNDNNFAYVSEKKADELRANNAHPGDIIFTQRGTLGQVGLIPQKSSFARYVISQSQMKMTVDESQVLPDWIYYYFAAPMTVKELMNKAFSSGVPHINLGILREFQVPIPPLTTQRKIAAILSAYDDLIENNLRRIKILEEMAQNLYREWFVKFRFPGHQNACFVDSPMGRIPEGWEVAELGRLANQIRDGVNPNSVNPDTPYIGLEHLPRKSISVNAWGRAGDVQSTKLIFKKSDILFGKIRPYFHKVGVAPFSGICSSDTIVIRPKTANLFGLILGCTSSSEFVEHATATSQGTKMPRANWDVLVKYQILMPPPPILSQLNEFIVEIVSQIHNFIFRIQNLRRTRDLLLPKLISGEVDVAELYISVPEAAA